MTNDFDAQEFFTQEMSVAESSKQAIFSFLTHWMVSAQKTQGVEGAHTAILWVRELCDLMEEEINKNTNPNKGT